MTSSCARGLNHPTRRNVLEKRFTEAQRQDFERWMLLVSTVSQSVFKEHAGIPQWPRLARSAVPCPLMPRSARAPQHISSIKCCLCQEANPKRHAEGLLLRLLSEIGAKLSELQGYARYLSVGGEEEMA